MMSPTEDFWNLQSKFRGKKEFNFYDKMVPQPFKITPSPTPTPSITPSCGIPPSEYECLNVSGFTGVNSWANGDYTFLGYGAFNEGYSPGLLECDCSYNYALYIHNTKPWIHIGYMFNVSAGGYIYSIRHNGFLGSPQAVYCNENYSGSSLILNPSPTSVPTQTFGGKIYPLGGSMGAGGFITFVDCITPTPSVTPTITPSISITPTPTPSVGWNSIYEFTIDTTNTQTNSSNSSSFDFLRTSCFFLSPDPGDIVIYWGDGSSSNPYDTGGRTHTYSSPGIYNIIVDSGSNSFFDKIGMAFQTTSGGLTGDCSKVIGCSRRPVNGVLGDFTACRNFTGFTGQAQYQVLTGSTNTYFRYCNSLVSGLSNFDVSQVTSMDNMFVECFAYNEDLSSWDTGNVTDMAAMFYSATSWNQNVGMWDISSVSQGGSNNSFINTFGETNLSTSNYDQILIGWAAQAPNINSNLQLFGVPCGYTSAAQSARNLLTSTYGWTINDGGLVP